MKIITCASYYGTGSSAVTDFFSEFRNVSSAGEYEFRFIHDPDGIRDLEYHIVENNNRHNTSNAIKRYLRYARYYGNCRIRQGYKRYMGTQFMRYTQEYINQITELQSEAYWHFDRIERSRVFSFCDTLLLVLGHKIFHTEVSLTLMKFLHEQSYYTAIDQEAFLKYTREYIAHVVQALNKKQTEYIMIDQLVPPSNINQYLRYFDDIHVVVTERDPRDIYLLEKIRWKDNTIPYENVKDFCKWYEIIRRHRKKEQYDSEKVLFLQFEDMVYHYDETAEKLIQFVGLDRREQVKFKKHFNPDVSIMNTNLKARYPQYAKDVRYIEEKLEEYLYVCPEKKSTQKIYDGWNGHEF